MLKTNTLPPDTPLRFDSPTSSDIVGAFYNPTVEDLTITFTRRGSKPSEAYVYAHVPPLIWLEFLKAESKGKFVAAKIAKSFTGRKMGS